MTPVSFSAPEPPQIFSEQCQNKRKYRVIRRIVKRFSVCFADHNKFSKKIYLKQPPFINLCTCSLSQNNKKKKKILSSKYYALKSIFTFSGSLRNESLGISTSKYHLFSDSFLFNTLNCLSFL